MPNTYTQIYLHFVFAVKGRQSLIKPSIRQELEQYISGIIKNEKQKMMAIYCMPDHTHIFISMSPDMASSDLLRVIKANSSKWLNESGRINGKFEWQSGYGAFSYATSQVKTVVNYILNQEAHHQKRTFMEEYVDFLEKFDIKYEKKYLFEMVV